MHDKKEKNFNDSVQEGSEIISWFHDVKQHTNRPKILQPAAKDSTLLHVRLLRTRLGIEATENY